MGSLMAGWDSHPTNSKHRVFMRNKSLTKEGIDEYWKLRKKTEDEHLQALSPPTSQRLASIRNEELGNNNNKEFKRSSSLPIIDTKRRQFKLTKEATVDIDVDANIEDLMKKNNGWWRRSNWAFLNEPPVIDSEVPRYKYASQHHVASFGTRISTN